MAHESDIETSSSLIHGLCGRFNVYFFSLSLLCHHKRFVLRVRHLLFIVLRLQQSEELFQLQYQQFWKINIL